MVRIRSWFSCSASLVAATLVTSIASAAPPPPPGGAPPPPSDEQPTRPGPPAGERLESPSDPLAGEVGETDLTGTWGYSRGGATSPNYVRGEDDEEVFFTVNPIGYYQGVSVHGGNLPPFAPKEVGGQTTAVLTWTGFERMPSSSRVFFQLSAAVEPVVVIEPGQIVVEFPATSIQVRNNRRKLITRFFKTPVVEVDIRRKKKTVTAVMLLRWPSEPTWVIEAAPNGYQVLVFEFPDVGAKADTRTEGADGGPPAEGKPPADSDAPFQPG